MYKEIVSPSTLINNELPLTKREKEILRHLSTGLQYKEIAEKLFISTETVKSHTANIYSKLKVNNRHEAVIRFHSINC
jgi:DNA-binding CsgD family transcriptional regulator